MNKTILIKGGQVVDPATKTNKVQDILIRDGVIKKVAAKIPAVPEKAETFEAKGMIVCPGLLDIHVHLREPGREDEETIDSGCRAAAAGGVTGVACMPNTEPAIDNQETVKFIMERAKGQPAWVYPVGAISKGRKGCELAEIGDMVDAGAVAVSDDGDWVADGTLMRRALEYTKIFKIPVISHCEDKSFIPKGGCMNEGAVCTGLGMKGIPRLAEDTAVARDIAIAAFTGGRLHIAHVSTAGAVQLVREAKKKGVKVTAETAPHYFCLDDSTVRTFNTSYKMNPPLRTRADIREIKRGLADGTIDCIASDHAPHAPEEKETEFDQAPNGIIGLETLFSLCLKELVPKVLSLPALIDKLTYKPAAILNIKKEKIRPGARADLAITDPKKKWTVGRDSLESQSLNTPWLGRTLCGKSIRTVL